MCVCACVRRCTRMCMCVCMCSLALTIIKYTLKNHHLPKCIKVTESRMGSMELDSAALMQHEPISFQSLVNSKKLKYRMIVKVGEIPMLVKT